VSKASVLRTLNVVALLIAPLFGCDNVGPALRVSVKGTVQGNVISVTNADRGVVTIKDVIINDRDECTYVEPASNYQTTPEFWLDGTNLDNNDRRQMWLQSISPKDALVPTQNGKYSACKDVCPEGYESRGFSYITSRNSCSKGDTYISGVPVCRKVSIGIFDKISLNIGDEKHWAVNARCQKIIRAKIVTDRGTKEYSFAE
jgi:hypothetical protein